MPTAAGGQGHPATLAVYLAGIVMGVVVIPLGLNVFSLTERYAKQTARLHR